VLSCVFVVLSSLVQSITIKAFRSTNSERRKRFTLSLVTYVNKLMKKKMKKRPAELGPWIILIGSLTVPVPKKDGKDFSFRKLN
jgi:hypothetical protein